MLLSASLVRVVVFVSLDGWDGCQAAPNCRPCVRLGMVPGRGWEGMHDLAFGDFAAAARNLHALMLRHDSAVPYRTVPHRTALHRRGSELLRQGDVLRRSTIPCRLGDQRRRWLTPPFFLGWLHVTTHGRRASRTTCLLLGCLHWPRIAVPYPPYGVPKELLV